MDFIYTEEQRMLADSLRRLVAQDWTQARRRKRQAAGTLDAGAWDALAGLGVLGLNIAENCGGFGEPPASLLPVHLELGRGLVSEPVIPSAVMGAALVAACGEGARRRWLPSIASGECIASVAWQEPGRRYDPDPANCRASRDGLGWRLDGAKHLVWHGAAAAVWLVCARGEDGAPLLLAVPAGIAGARVTDTPTLDGARCARLDFDGVRLDAEALLAQGEPARQALAESLHWDGPRCARMRPGRWSACWRSPSTISRPASSSASPWQASRRCSIASPRCTWPRSWRCPWPMWRRPR